MSVIALDLQGLHTALKRSFVDWSSKHPKYGALWKKINENTVQIAFDAIEEMKAHKPGYFEVWWAVNHNRYIRRKEMTQKQLILLHEVFHAYLAWLARSKLSSVGKDDDSSEDNEDANTNDNVEQFEERAARRKVKGRR